MQGGPFTLMLQLVAVNQPEWSFKAWPATFMGGRQAYAPSTLPPGFPGFSADPPPFSDGGPVALPASIVAMLQPNPWTYSFAGGRQPFDPRKLPPALSAVPANDPPFTRGGPVAIKSELFMLAQPNPWTYTFMGSAQPFGPKRRSSAIPGQSINNPPFTLGGPFALKLEAIAINQPGWSYTAWPYTFMGRRGPYMPRLFPPGLAAVVVSPFPYSSKGRTAAFQAIRAAWNPPPPDMQMTLYATRPTPQRLRVTARGYIIL